MQPPLPTPSEVNSSIQSWIRPEELHRAKWCMQKEGRRFAACTLDCIVRVAEDFPGTMLTCPEGVIK